MIREVHTIIVFGATYKVGDLYWGDFVAIKFHPEEIWHKILTEFNEKAPELNERQSKELRDFLTQSLHKNGEQHKKDNKKLTKENLEDEFIMIEGQLMHHLNQPLSEIRKWPLKYIMGIYYRLPEILGFAKEKNEKPDKKSLKKYLGKYYE